MELSAGLAPTPVDNLNDRGPTGRDVAAVVGHVGGAAQDVGVGQRVEHWPGPAADRRGSCGVRRLLGTLGHGHQGAPTKARAMADLTDRCHTVVRLMENRTREEPVLAKCIGGRGGYPLIRTHLPGVTTGPSGVPLPSRAEIRGREPCSACPHPPNTQRCPSQCVRKCGPTRSQLLPPLRRPRGPP